MLTIYIYIYIYVNNILYFISTPTCFEAAHNVLYILFHYKLQRPYININISIN